MSVAVDVVHKSHHINVSPFTGSRSGSMAPATPHRGGIAGPQVVSNVCEVPNLDRVGEPIEDGRIGYLQAVERLH